MSPPGDFGTRVNKSLAWSGLASGIIGALDAVSLVILLRFWITRAELGVATFAAAFFLALELAADMGLSAAIIQRDETPRSTLSTLFWLNLMLAGLLFCVIALGGPLLAHVQGEPLVASLLMAFGGVLFVKAFYSVPIALMRRELRFQELSVIRIIANLADTSVKLGSAAMGAGPWCFVLGPAARQLVTGVCVYVRNPWLPRFVYRGAEAREYIAFGLKASGSKILYQVYTNLDYQVVGYFFGREALGAYRAAYELVLITVRYISEIFVNISFAAYSRIKTDLAQVRERFLIFTRQNLVVVATVVGVIAVEADDLLIGFIHEGYGPAVGAARILAVVGLLRALSYLGPSVLDALGQPGRSLRYQTVAAVTLTSLFVAFAVLFPQMGFFSVALAWAVGYPVAFVFLAVMVLARLELSAWTYLSRVGGIPLCVLGGVAAGWAVRLAVGDELPRLLRLGLVVPVMVVAIAVLLAVFQKITPRSIARSIRGAPS